MRSGFYDDLHEAFDRLDCDDSSTCVLDRAAIEAAFDPGLGSRPRRRAGAPEEMKRCFKRMST